MTVVSPLVPSPSSSVGEVKRRYGSSCIAGERISLAYFVGPGPTTNVSAYIPDGSGGLTLGEERVGELQYEKWRQSRIKQVMEKTRKGATTTLKV